MTPINSKKGQAPEENVSDEATQNYEQLWPNHTSPLKATDPELMEVFHNFALDEVVNHDDMDSQTRAMVIMASTLGSQSLGQYKKMVKAALNVGITPVQIKEVLYQSVPYVGFSKASDFVHATNEIFTERGIELPLEGQSNTTRETRFDKGLNVQKEIFGDVIDEMHKNAPEELQHIQQSLSGNCFGDYYTREGLDLKTRELVTLSYLIAMGGTESQVKGHIQGNANVGNGRHTLINVITQLLPYVGYPRTLNAINCLNEVLPKKEN